MDRFGVESDHFNVWMRSAALPSFDNLWGRIDGVDALDSGVSYVASFVVEEKKGARGQGAGDAHNVHTRVAHCWLIGWLGG